MAGLYRVALAAALACGLWAAATQKECDDALVACAKTNNCAKKPDSKECKACKSAHDSCTAKVNEQLRAAKKTTKR
ncbi:MAG: hypothetical protein HY821_06550 [Acidobacteria bacterium]|nr:hypothetical protein [Acidobacteriota bacterium]